MSGNDDDNAQSGQGNNPFTPPSAAQFQHIHPSNTEAATRSNRPLISGTNDLTDSEKTMLMKPLEAFRQCRPDYVERGPVPESSKLSAFAFVFANGWTPKRGMGGCPKLPLQRGDQINTQVGVLSKDLPASKKKSTPKKRRANGESPATTPNPNISPKACRMRGAPVFLAPCLNFGEGECTWMWKDSENSLINWRDSVEFLPGMDAASAKVAAAIQYDDSEIYRVMTHNQQLTRWIMRRYIVYWQNFPSGGKHIPDLRDAYEQFAPLELIQDLCKRIVSEWQALMDQLKDTVDLDSLTKFPNEQ
ncbi:hypothetical protein HJFPF1_11610 [Paramyrothecium foliicola]|nr:hypothetical protein HJFPF1_11610 [Paramyrothecium foliicola]